MNGQEYSRLTHEEIVERLPAFVVGALDPEEMLEVEEYLNAHPELMGRVQELELAAAKLAYAAAPQPLPKEVHLKVMNRARASLPPKPQTADNPRIERPQPRESWLAAWWRTYGFRDLGLAGAVAAALILGVVYLGAVGQIGELHSQVQELSQQVATMQTQNNALQVENIQLQSELETRQNQLASLAGSQQMVALGGTEAAPGASGRLYVHDDVGTLVLSNLDALSEEQIYQLWLIPPEGTPIAAGLLGNSSAPVEMITLQLPASLDGIAAVGVSIEPPGGSEAPTGPIVLLGETA